MVEEKLIRAGDEYSRTAVRTLKYLIGFLLLLAVGLAVFYTMPAKENMLAEVGNVGGGATFKIYPLTKDLGKAPQCRKDADCPPDTVCSHEGVCIPQIHNLPPSLSNE
jgi:hypothetical protein